MAMCGAPEHLRSNNGPDVTANVVREWLAKVCVTTLCIEPGSAWETNSVESLNAKLRDELPIGEIFRTP